MACSSIGQDTACTTDNTVTFADANYALSRSRSGHGRPHSHHRDEAPVTPCGGNSGSSCPCVTNCCGQEAPLDCSPVNCMQEGNDITYRLCCDPNGVCCYYDCRCRDPFWPHFAHPRWLCCKDLYCSCQATNG